MQRTSRKLDHQGLGPYRFAKVVTPYAYEINFPPTLKYHQVQNVCLLNTPNTDPLLRQHNDQLLPVIVDGEEKHDVEEILDARIFHQKLQYLIGGAGRAAPPGNQLLEG